MPTPKLVLLHLAYVCATMLSVTGLRAAPLYSANFEGAVGPEWSTNRVSTTPVGARRFLGPFANNAVTLTLSNLPVGTPLVLELDLFIIGTWDGNSRSTGPDLFSVLVGNAVLLNTTFKQPGPFPKQSFPSNYLVGEHMALTGAREIASLGSARDSVYHLTFNVTPSNAVQTFTFVANGLEGVNNESWGIDNVRIVEGRAPVLSISAPFDQQGMNPPATLAVVANASDPDGFVTNVSFFTNGVLVGSVVGAPYEILLNQLPTGVYRVTVEATDNFGIRSTTGFAFLVGGLRGEYFNELNRTGTRIQRADPQIDFIWTENAPPQPGFGAAGYSVRWTGELVPTHSETFTFFVTADDRATLRLNGEVVAECGRGSCSGTYALQAGVPVSLQLDFEQDSLTADISLEWQSASRTRQVIPQSQLRFPASSGNYAPNAPVFETPPRDALVVPPANAVFRTAAFNDVNATNTHAASDWEIRVAGSGELVWAAYGKTGAERVSVALNDGAFQGGYAASNQLPMNARLLVRTRHKDNSGVSASEWSQWSERSFNTFTPMLLVHGGTTWRFLDAGTLAPADWPALGFDDSTWNSGLGEFGYGDVVNDISDARTEIAFGTNSAAKPITTYFRTRFEAANPAAVDALELGLICDDGAVIYLNGVEVYRHNMPTGLVSPSTLALAEVPNGLAEYTLQRVPVPASLLLTGANVLAVEVHLATSNSPDLSFYGELTALRRGREPQATFARSDFFSDDESWSMRFNGTNSPQGDEHLFAFGGNPASHFAYYDSGDAQSSFFHAPAKFRGNLLSSYGGFVEFDTRVSSLGRSEQIVRLHGPGIAIRAAAPYVRRTTWLPFRIPIDASGGWRLTSPTNYAADFGPATAADILAVLANVTALQIHAEAYDAQDQIFLDNVRIVSGACDDPAPILLSRVSESIVELRWPQNRTCLVLESSTQIQGPWVRTFPIVSSTAAGGWRRTQVTASETRFYRLRPE